MEQVITVTVSNSFGVTRSRDVKIIVCRGSIRLPDASTKVITYYKDTGIHTEEKFSEFFLTTSESCTLTYSFTEIGTSNAMIPFTGTDIAFNIETGLITVNSKTLMDQVITVTASNMLGTSKSR